MEMICISYKQMKEKMGGDITPEKGLLVQF